MGLGKTLTMIALIAETINAAKDSVAKVTSDDSSDVEFVVQDLESKMPKMTGLSLRKIMSHPICQFEKRASSSTLIIAPVSLLGHWRDQIYHHCVEKSLTCHIYHGTSRSKTSLNDLIKFDVIVTTYQVVANELSKAVQETKASVKYYETICPLHLIDWYRIVLVSIILMVQYGVLKSTIFL